MKGLIIVLFLGVALASPFDSRSNANRVGVEPISKSSHLQGRITNGLTAKDGQLNYQVGLFIRLSFFSASWCGGSLISPEWIVTAAHCTDGSSRITAYLGSVKRQGGTAAQVIEKIVHSGWNPNTVTNDIALLRISPVTLGKNINTVALPAIAKSYSDYMSEGVIASGWGEINDYGSVPNSLQYARMEITSNQACMRYFGPLMKSTNICAVGPRGTSTCSGDSGGPIVTESSKILVGLTSFGSSEGCTLGYPESFTRITSYRTWIQEHTGI